LLGVHASPEADSGPGIRPGISDDDLGRLLAGCAADVVVGGHTHTATDRLVDGIRVLNPGSTGIPLRPGEAGWLLLEFADGPESRDDPGRGTVTGLRVSNAWCRSTSMPWSVICTPGCTRTRSSSRPS